MKKGDKAFIVTNDRSMVEEVRIIGEEKRSHGEVWKIKRNPGVSYAPKDYVFETREKAMLYAEALMGDELAKFKINVNNKEALMTTLFKNFMIDNENSLVNDYVADLILEYTEVDVRKPRMVIGESRSEEEFKTLLGIVLRGE